MKKFLCSFTQYMILVVLLYGFLPTIVWIFSGEFKEVSQNMYYIAIGGLVSLIGAAAIMEDISKKTNK